LTDTPAKLTITEIVKSKTDADPNRSFARPFFAGGGSPLSSAEIGTATHTFLQFADFARAESNARAEAARLADMGLLTDVEAGVLDYRGIDAFFKTVLYARIKKSSKIYRERKFLVDLSEITLDGDLSMEYNNGMLQGIADCFFEEGGGFVLLDYKTDRSAEPQILEARYRHQLMLYKAAIEHIYGFKVVGTYIYSFRLGCEIPL
jgi:ATP-dependent helicase/nuclease subunit A